jgi:hypothetical protein
MSVISEFGRLRQEDHVLKANLCYIAKTLSQKQNERLDCHKNLRSGVLEPKDAIMAKND